MVARFTLLLTVFAALGAARADEPPKEGDLVIHSSDFTVTKPNKKTHKCRKAEFGTHTLVDGKLVYHLGIVDYTCDEARHDIQVICRVSWGPEEGTPPEQIEAANAIGVTQVITLSQKTGLDLNGDDERFTSVSKNRIDAVAAEYLGKKCLAKMPDDGG